MSGRPSSMIMTRIGGVEYPMRSVMSCLTCQSPHRSQIENDLIKGYSYASIARSLDGLPTGRGNRHPSAESIAEHCKNDHVPIAAATQRRLIERRSREIGTALEEGVDAVIDSVVVSQMILAKGFERMQAGEIKPDVNDMLQASKFLFMVDQAQGDGGVDQNAMLQVLHVYLETARDFIPQEQWQAYGAAISAHPIIREIQAKQEAARRGDVGEE